MMRLLSSVLLLALVVAGPAFRHPDHGTLVELEHRAKSGAVEIAIELSAWDLERALTRFHETPVATDRVTKKLETRTFAWLEKGFRLRLADAKTDLELTWVGMEFDEGSAWLYVEGNAGTSIDKMSVTHRLLESVADGHVHTVNARSGRRAATLHLDTSRPTGSVTLR